MNHLFCSLVFLQPALPVTSFTSLLWIVVVNDYILKMFTMVIKICVIVIPGSILAYTRRVKASLSQKDVVALYWFSSCWFGNLPT